MYNTNKGSDIATILEDTQIPIRFYNPRIDIWAEHFEIESSGLLHPKTLIAQATIKILDLNQVESIIERSKLIQLGLLS